MKTASKLPQTTALLLATSLCSSCCTTSLWRSTDPNECIEVSFDEMTEEALREDGFNYRKDAEKQLFFIEKDPSQKFGSYALRVVGTPITVTADTLLVGFMAYGLAFYEAPADGINWDHALVEWGYH